MAQIVGAQKIKKDLREVRQAENKFNCLLTRNTRTFPFRESLGYTAVESMNSQMIKGKKREAPDERGWCSCQTMRFSKMPL